MTCLCLYCMMELSYSAAHAQTLGQRLLVKDYEFPPQSMSEKLRKLLLVVQKETKFGASDFGRKVWFTGCSKAKVYRVRPY